MATASATSGSVVPPSNPPVYRGIITKENEKNANKLQTLYRHIVRLILRFFHTFFPRDPIELYKELKQHRKEIKRLRFNKEITPEQQRLIFPPNSQETYSDEFDPTLMRIMIAKIANTNKPEKFWVTEPPVTDKSTEANIVRLLRERNNIQHTPGYVPNDVYKEIAKRVMDAMVALGEDRKTFDYLLPPIQYGSFESIDNFAGRQSALKIIHEIIEKDKNEMLRLVIHGLAGVGKSELVRRCYEQLKETFEKNILWIDTTTKSTLESSFLEIADKLEIPIKDENGQFTSISSIIDRVHQCFQADPVLFIFDDVNDIKSIIPFLPKWKPSCTIITTQIKDWRHGGFKLVQLNKLDHSESKSFIVSNLKVKITEKQILEVLSQIDGHPLALQQFAAAINDTMQSVEEFIQHFKDESTAILGSNLQLMHEKKSTTSTIKIVTDRLRDSQNSQLAYEIINTISYLYGEKITLEILKMIFFEHNVTDIDLAINKLSCLSLINKKNVDDQNIVTVHSLVQKCLIWQHKKNQGDQKYLYKCLAMFESKLDVDETISRHEAFGEKWYKEFVTFVLVNMEHPKVSNLLHNKPRPVYDMLITKGKFNDFIEIMKSLEKISAKLNGSLHGTVICAMSWHARACNANGETDRAIALNEEVLEKQKMKLGGEHPDTLSTMQNLANRYSDKGETDRAIALNKEVLEKRKMKLGVEHPDTLSTMQNFANRYRDKGETDRAIALNEEVLEKRKMKLGKHHPDTLLTMHNMACYYSDKGETERAIVLNEEVLEKRKIKLGEEHPRTLSTMQNLANRYSEKGETDRAIALNEEVLEKRKIKLGDQHPDTLLTMHNLAFYYSKKGETDRAIVLSEKVLEKRKMKLGEQHPDTLLTMQNLASYYSKKGETDLAIALNEEVLEKQKMKLGEQHPHTLSTMQNLANRYSHKGETDRAIALNEEVLEKIKMKLGEEHPHTLSTMHNLACYYSDKGETDRSIALNEEVLEKRKMKLGEEHPHTLSTMQNLANRYSDKGETDRAIALNEVVLEKRKMKLGEHHPDTLLTMHNLACYYSDKGETDRAIALNEEVLEKRKLFLLVL